VANEGDAVSHAGPANEESFTRSLVADTALGPLRGLLLTLTVVTGVVDAVSILATALLALVTAWVALATRQPAGWRAFPAQRR